VKSWKISSAFFLKYPAISMKDSPKGRFFGRIRYMKLERENIFYEEVFLVFNKAEIDYLACGGVAVTLYGFTRLTVDLDLIVNLEKEKNILKLKI